jgi:hypothetical protein
MVFETITTSGFCFYLTTLSISLTIRHHNSNDEYTKITKKIIPNSELGNEQNCPANRGHLVRKNSDFVSMDIFPPMNQMFYATKK